jgi:TolA-binding protein
MFEEALALYEQVKNPSGKDFEVLTLLHGGQAAAQVKQWEKSLQMLTQCTEKFPDTPHLPEALYEQGWAQQNLGKLDEAIALYKQVIAKTRREVAARAQFMIGEIEFAQKKHEEAVKSFFVVVYGYASPKWQAEAAFEAARCFEVLGKKTQAVKMYRELTELFPKSDKANAAAQRINELEP